VDDIFAIISREGDPEAILAQANTISDTVKFTLEKQREGSLAFLDVKITKNRSKLITSVYRKAIDSGRYLHYKSNHPRSVKVGVAACLLERAESHCGTEKAKKEERKRVIKTLKNNGYQNTVFNELLMKEKRRKNGDEKRKTDYKNVLAIPVMGTIPKKKVSRYDTDTSNFDDTIPDTILYRVVKVFRYQQSI
jgi:hypothetical protein